MILRGTDRLGTRVAIVMAIAGALLACQKREPPAKHETAKRYIAPESLDRELNRTELDSLQQMKLSHAVTRDEYWDGYGGVLANDAVEVWYPDGKLNVMQGMAMLKYAMSARARTRQLFGTVPSERAVIICSGDIDTYVAATGREWWHYSRIVGDTISIQPPIHLHGRGLLTVVGPREYYEWVLGKLSKGKAPRWVEEGFASYLAGEGAVLEDMRTDFAGRPLVMSMKDMESALARETDRQETRRAYYNAYRIVDKIVTERGEGAMARFVVALGETGNVDDASRSAFNADFDDVVEAGRAWSRAQ